MKIKVIAFNKDIIDDVFDIQQKAYKLLFDKYQDKETNPYMESKEVVLEKYTRPGTYGYVFIENDLPVGAVRIAMKNNVCKVSALAVLPEYQNRGIAQSALREIEKIHGSANKWVLDTLMWEAGNCRLYEKLGYVRIGEPRIISDKLTIVGYAKEINPEQSPF